MHCIPYRMIHQKKPLLQRHNQFSTYIEQTNGSSIFPHSKPKCMHACAKTETRVKVVRVSEFLSKLWMPPSKLLLPHVFATWGIYHSTLLVSSFTTFLSLARKASKLRYSSLSNLSSSGCLCKGSFWSRTLR